MINRRCALRPVVALSLVGLSCCGKNQPPIEDRQPGVDARVIVDSAAAEGSTEAASAANDVGISNDAAVAPWDSAADAFSEERDAASGSEPSVSCARCSNYGAPSTTGKVQSSALKELSGIELSRNHPGVIYAHNDSGDSARFFAFEQSGTMLAEIQLTAARAVDWEDMALGPCPEGTCVFLADFGDNAQVRKSIQIFRVKEPDLEVGRPFQTLSNVPYDRFEYAYEQGPQNAETLMIHPRTGDLYIVTKRSSGPSGIYRIASPKTSSASPTVLTRLAEITPPNGENLLTGGAIHPCGDGFIIRSYDRLWEYRSKSQDLHDAFATQPVSVPVASAEKQGEAVAYFPDGRGYVTASEGETPEIHTSRCP